jgi:hypothetical protein
MPTSNDENGPQIPTQPLSGVISSRAKFDSAPSHSSLVCFQTDTDLSSFTVGEENAGFFKCILYFEGSGKVSFHNSLTLLDPLKRRQADPCHASEPVLAPAQKRARRPYLGGISHRFLIFSDSSSIDNNSVLIYYKS